MLCNIYNIIIIIIDKKVFRISLEVGYDDDDFINSFNDYIKKA